jgi:hypothetical protein
MALAALCSVGQQYVARQRLLSPLRQAASGECAMSFK